MDVEENEPTTMEVPTRASSDERQRDVSLLASPDVMTDLVLSEKDIESAIQQTSSQSMRFIEASLIDFAGADYGEFGTAEMTMSEIVNRQIISNEHTNDTAEHSQKTSDIDTESCSTDAFSMPYGRQLHNTNAEVRMDKHYSTAGTCDEHCIPAFCRHNDGGSSTIEHGMAFPMEIGCAEFDDLLLGENTQFQSDFEAANIQDRRTEGQRNPAGPSTAENLSDSLHFLCDIDNCSKVFISEGILRKHKRRVHKVKYVCKFADCAEEFDTPTDQKEHAVSYHLTCNIDNCGRSFKKSVHVEDHKRKEHNAERVLCDFANCGMSYAARKNMISHKRRAHFPQEKVLCNIDECGISFTQRKSMLAHQRNIHYKKTSCAYLKCRKTFETEALLHHHILTCHLHRAELVCKYCGRRFTSHIDLNDHLLSIHGESAHGNS